MTFTASGADLVFLDSLTYDDAPVVSAGATTTAPGNTGEDGTQATFTAVLNTAPTGDVTIPVSSSDTTEGTVSPASLTFTSANWNATQTVTVTGVDDSLDDGNIAYSIVLGAATSTDGNYSAYNAADVAVTNVDNDTSGVTAGAMSGSTTEAGVTGTFTVKLNSQPSADIVMAVTSLDTTEGTVSPASLTFTSANWAANQTVTVTGVDDSLVDGAVAYTLRLGVPSSGDASYQALSATDVSASNTDNDTAGTTLGAISGNTVEDGTQATFTVVLNAQPSADVAIALSSSDTTEGTVSPASLTFTNANWNSAQTVTVTGVDDALVDGNQTYQINLASPTSGDASFAALTATSRAVTNTDNDTPGFTISAMSGNTTEAGVQGTFTVKLNAAPTANVVIPITSSNTAEGTVSPSSLTFTSANWSSNQTVTVTGIDDSIDDGNQSYSLVLAAVTSTDGNYSGLNPADVAAINTDNDTFGFTSSAMSGSTGEDGTTGTFTLKLASQPTASVTIGVTSSDTTEGTVSPATLTFTTANWNANQTVTVTGVNDDLIDGNQTYSLVLAAASSADGTYNTQNPADVSATNIDNNSAGFTISAMSGNTVEDGTTGTFTVKLTSQPTASVTIGVTSSDTTEGTVSPSTLTFTTANWNANQTVTVTGVDDAIVDGNQTYSLVLAAATSGDGNYNGVNPADVSATNTDNDTAGFTISAMSGNTVEDGTTGTFTVKLTSQPTASVTIGVTSSDTTEGTVSPATLTFSTANWNANQTVTVTGVDDAIIDGNQTYSLVLAAATSGDGNYNGVNPADVSATNTDNDTAGFTISAMSGNTVEDGTTGTFTVKLNSQPTASVTIGVTSSDTTEGTVSPSTVTFSTANWNANQTVTVTGIDDSIDDGNQSYNLVLAAATSGDGNYSGLNPADVAAINTDNDTFGFTASAMSGNTGEDGTTGTFTLKLASQPTASVTIGVTSSNTAEGTVSPSTLTFSTANWNANQTVTVTGVDDSIVDGNQTYSLVLAAATSGDGNYSGQNPADVSATNTDNDTAGFTVSAASGNTVEDGTTATFTVKLTSQPTNDVTFGLTSSVTTEGTVSPSTLTFTNANWNANQTVTLTGVDDYLVDGNQSYSIVLAAATSTDGNYSGLNPADVSMTNTDNDTAGFTIGTISGNTAEIGTTATATVKLTSQPTNDVTFAVTSSDTTEGTVSPSTLTFTNANWNANQTVTLTGVDDFLVDGNQSYSIVLAAATSSDGNYSGLNPTDVAVINIDSDTAGFTIGTISGNTAETGTTATATVKLTSQPTSDVTFAVTSSDTTEGTVSPATLTFTYANWNANQTVTLTGIDDFLVDGNQSYSIVLAAATSADGNYNTLNPADVAVINTDNDTAGFTIGTISGNTAETGTTATATVKLTSQPTNDVTFAVTSSDTTEGTVSPSTLTFTNANWNANQTVTLTGIDDSLVDGNQNYSLVLAAATSSDGNYSGLNPTDVAVINTDNDTAGFTIGTISGNTAETGTTATATVKLTSQPTSDVTFAVTSSDTTEGTVSPSTLTFTNANWNANQTVTLTGVDDFLVDGNQSYSLVLAAATSSDGNYNTLNPADVAVINTDNDTAGFTIGTISGNTAETGATATVTVTLTSQPTSDVTFSVTSSDTTEGTVSPATLTFTNANWNANQTVTVTGVDDVIVDGNQTYSLVLAAAASGDGNYNGLNPADVSATNTDNDTAAFTVSAASGNTVEDGTTATFTVKLNTQPTNDVTFAVTSSDTTEGTVSPSTLTFTNANWNANQTVTLTGIDDSLVDGNQTYNIVLAAATSTDGNYSGLNPADVSMINTDNDTAGFTIGAISGNTAETGTTATFTLKLLSQPTADVSVGVTSSDTGEGTVDVSTLTFTSSNWSTNQRVSITGIDDDLADGTQSYTVLLAAATSSDTAYSGMDPSDVTVNNTDNETAGFSLGAASGSVTEVGGFATVAANLNSQPSGNVVFRLSVSDATEATVSPSTMTFTVTNWNAEQTITVTGVADTESDGDQSFTLAVSVDTTLTTDTTGYTSLSAGSVTLVNIDEATNHAPTASKMVFPANQALVTAPVTLGWNSATDVDGDTVSYKVTVCENSAFTGCSAVSALSVAPGVSSGLPWSQDVYAAGVNSGLGVAGTLEKWFWLFLLLGLTAGLTTWVAPGRKKWVIAAAAVLIGVAGCKKMAFEEPGVLLQVEHTFDFAGGAPGVTYYWRVTSLDNKGGETFSETWSFTGQ